MAQSALRNLPLERMNARRARAGMEAFVPQAPTKTAGQAMADMLGGMSIPLSFVPVAGDFAGLAADAAMYATRPEERTLGNAAMTLAGIVPGIPGAAAMRAGGQAAEGALDMSQAARMQRAKDQNFYDRLFYHATTGDFPAFQKSKMGTSSSLGTKEKAVWLSSDPRVAETYLPGQFVNRENAPHTEDIGGGVGRYYSEGSNIMPLRVSLEPEKIAWWDMGGARYNPEDVEEILANARREGMQAVAFKNIRDEGVMGLGSGRSATSLAVFDPKNIRSVNAAFDPAKRNSANLTAGIMGGAVGLSALRQLMPQQEQE